MDKRISERMDKRIAQIADKVLDECEQHYQAGVVAFLGPLRPLDYTCYACSLAAEAAYEAGWRDAHAARTKQRARQVARV